jgi:uncharacterized membrane protein SpoIIM required for sporulation
LTPLQFDARYQEGWRELEAALDGLEGRRKATKAIDGARLAWLYRGACEQLALARARAYPVDLVERLEGLTQRAHQAIYQQPRTGAARLLRLFLVDVPRAVRAHARYVLVATLAFMLPLAATAIATARDPGFALTVQSAESLRQYERMYGDDAQAFGRERKADSDVQMFGYYVMNNIGIAFRSFASGIFFGLGSLLVLVFNGVFAGTIAGYLTARGMGPNFYSFVVTHGAFELTAIVLAGAAGLALGHALLAPGRRTRLAALREAAHGTVPILYGLFAMLMVAAFVEAFWSSARWVPHEIKYGVGATCWILVLGWLSRMGRSRDLPKGGRDAG